MLINQIVLIDLRSHSADDARLLANLSGFAVRYPDALQVGLFELPPHVAHKPLFHVVRQGAIDDDGLVANARAGRARADAWRPAA